MPPPAARTPWGTISREQVIDAALRIVAEHGYQQLTVRAVATALGVAPMSLYRHVRDKDDLLDEVVDRLLASAWQPRARESDPAQLARPGRRPASAASWSSSPRRCAST